MKTFSQFLTEAASVSFLREWFVVASKIPASKISKPPMGGSSFIVDEKFDNVSETFKSKYKMISSSKEKGLKVEFFDVSGNKIKVYQVSIDDKQTSVSSNV